MSEESLPVPQRTLDEGRDDGRARRAAGRPAAGPTTRRESGPPRARAQAPSRGRMHVQVRAHAHAPAPADRGTAGSSRPTPNVLALAAIGLGYALIAGSFRRLTAPAELSTFAAGSFLTWQALRNDLRRRPAPDHVDAKGSMVWVALLAVFAIWELYADFRGSTPDHPTLSILMGPVLEDPVNRALGYMLWLGTGVWLVRR